MTESIQTDKQIEGQRKNEKGRKTNLLNDRKNW